MIHLGAITSFSKLPTKITMNEEKYFLTKINEQYKLLSSICPHQSGEIHFHDDDDECFKCEVHNWTFAKDGQSQNIKSMQMQSYEVEELNGHLYARINNGPTNIVKKEKNGLLPSIKLHSHACIEIVLDDFSLLCDPWLEGNAFLGAWIPYPAPNVTVAELHPDAIWISHEHSDHFHEPTLAKFDKSIPVYVPHFPNCRMEEKLEKLGFTQIISVRFGEPVQLVDNFTITTYEPASLWNDAIVLIEAGDFRILNLNDTGINRAIAKKIGAVDLVASSFSPGASGYPLTWTHLTDDEKVEKMLSAKSGMLKMIEQSMSIYSAKYFLPFASYFSLWHEKHLRYIDLMQKNTLFDVCNYFVDSDVTVIDLLPGDEWNVITNEFHRLPRHPEMFEKEYVLNYIRQQDFTAAYEEVAPKNTDVTFEQMERYFLRLNDIPEMIFCEDVTIQVNAHGESCNTLFFEVKNGQLQIVPHIEEPNITFNVPAHILQFVITENESWDEPIIGYWCEFSRNPDVYHADFWRLLQAPYYKKAMKLVPDNRSAIVTLDSNVAATLEKYGEPAARILGRYGLYCIACQYAPFENIKSAAQIHGLSEEKQKRLVQELNRSLV